ncbi:DNA polymerase IV [Serratia rubidaea]|uniref:DNA polymerase IV n=1 Tax=Serratia rubidaea TaxID=61652 RepID=A0A4U9HEV1_SERRU|nr:DNA polymerase IV [Serratia rubidaea]
MPQWKCATIPACGIFRWRSGGSAERRGVISTANYPARRYGVRSAMSTAMALKLCPQLTLLPGPHGGL